MKQNVIQQLTDVQHVLKRPEIYIGSTSQTTCGTYLFNTQQKRFEYGIAEYVPAFLKIVFQVIDNSVDEAIRTEFKYATSISVSIDETTSEITVRDDGRGIPLDLMPGTKTTMLECALTSLRAGSNFNDQGRDTLGMNGVGASITNIFSTEFMADVYNAGKHGVLKCSGNLSKKSCTVSQSKVKRHGTEITFKPDLKKFNLSEIGENHVSMIIQKLMFLAVTYPEIRFTFNGKPVIGKGFNDFMKLFADDFQFLKDDNTPQRFLIGVIPNQEQDFTHKSYVNGSDCINGGNHLDVINSEITSRIRERLLRKYPAIKNGDIKSKMSYVVIFRGYVNPVFNSQTKENFSSPVQDIRKFLSDVNWDQFVDKIYRNKSIIDPITETFRLKEQLKDKQSLESMGKTRGTFRCSKFLPATKQKRYFAIVEGDSACAGLMEGLGRSCIGYFSTRGVPLNTYEVKASKITENQELSNIIKCLNLKLLSDNQKLTYENILLSSDQDADGVHISQLYIAFFHKYAPQIIRDGKLKKLMTPIICMKNKAGEIKHFFFDLNEYNDFIRKNSTQGLSVHYYKGLGSWKAKELRGLVDKYGLDKFIHTLEYDQDSDKLIDEWVGKANVERRKEYLRQNQFSIFGI